MSTTIKSLKKNKSEKFSGIISRKSINEAKDNGLVSLDTKKITRWKLKNRHPNDIGDLVSLKKSIQTVGQIEPIIVTRRNNNYILIAGERRYLACKELNIEVEAKIIPEKKFNTDIALQIQEEENDESLPPSDYGRYLHYRNLLNEKIARSQQELAIKLRKSKQYISRVMSFDKLNQDLMEALDLFKLGYSRLEQLLEIQKQEGGLELLLKNARQINEGFAVTKLKDALSKVSNKQSVKKRESLWTSFVDDDGFDLLKLKIVENKLQVVLDKSRFKNNKISDEKIAKIASAIGEIIED